MVGTIKQTMLEPPPLVGASWTRKRLGVKNLLANGAHKIVGNGDNILVWEDPWLPDLLGFSPRPRFQGEESCLVVSQLMKPSRTGWDKEKLRSLFDQDSINAIRKIPVWISSQPDRWSWIKTESGAFGQICIPSHFGRW